MSWPALSYEARAPDLRDAARARAGARQARGDDRSPEPQLQHAAVRLTARGWETLALPAPDGSGAFVVALDLRTHEAWPSRATDVADRSRSSPAAPFQ
jgi:hypothetical protein